MSDGSPLTLLVTFIQFNVAVLIVNQVSSDPGAMSFQPDKK